MMFINASKKAFILLAFLIFLPRVERNFSTNPMSFNGSKKGIKMISKIKSRFAAVNDDENGAETIEVVLLTVFFVLVVGGVAFFLKGRINQSTTKMGDSFDNVNSGNNEGGYTFPDTP